MSEHQRVALPLLSTGVPGLYAILGSDLPEYFLQSDHRNAKTSTTRPTGCSASSMQHHSPAGVMMPFGIVMQGHVATPALTQRRRQPDDMGTAAARSQVGP